MGGNHKTATGSITPVTTSIVTTPTLPLLPLSTLLLPLLLISLLISLALSITIPSALAVASINYRFFDSSGNALPNVQTEVFTCADSSCSAVNNTFRVSGNSGGANSFTVNYPTVLQSSNGYALYHFASCYVPRSFVATWAGNGGITVSNTFSKISLCRASINSLSVFPSSVAGGAITAGTPVTITASFASAFTSIINPPLFIPPGNDASYTSDTTSRLIVRDASGTGNSGNILLDTSRQSGIFAGSAKTESFSFTPSRKGTYTATFTTDVTDCQCSSALQRTSSLQFTVQNTAPVIAPIGDKITNEGQTLSFTVSASDADNDALSFSAIGLPAGATLTPVSNPLPSPATKIFSWNPSFNQAGTYNVVFSVSDGEAVANVNVRITVINVNIPPAVSISANQTSGTSPMNVRLQAFASDADGTIVSISWNFVDGTTGTGAVVEHTYGAGTFFPSVTATDNNGASASAGIMLVVSQDFFPSAFLAVNQTSGISPVDVALSCSGSAGNAPLLFRLSFGDGSPDTLSGFFINAAHRYTAPSTASFPTVATAVCTVTDADGDVAQSSQIITVTPDSFPNVTAAVNQTLAKTNSRLQFTSSVIGGNNPIIFLWNFGDGASSSLANPIHAFSAPGTYDEMLTATDIDGDSARATVRVNVANNFPPAVSISANQTSGTVPANASFSVAFSSVASDADGFIVSLLWNFGDGASSSLVNPIHAFSAPGNYTVSLTVTDNDGASASASMLITVNTIIPPPPQPSPQLNVTSLSCFSSLATGNTQSCSITVFGNGSLQQGALVNLIDNSTSQLYGTCITQLSGVCSVNFTNFTVPSQGQGIFTVFATASKSGFLPDNDRFPAFSFTVFTLSPRYSIVGLATFNDSLFLNPDTVFFRNETIFTKFTVIDLQNNLPVSGVITSVILTSPPGGVLGFTRITENGGTYFYSSQIPPTHSFLGNSQIFTFAFNTTDNSSGQAIVNVSILNNAPVILPFANFTFNEDSGLSSNLASFEFDVEDYGTNGANLTWSADSGNNSLFTAVLINSSGQSSAQSNQSGFKTLVLQGRPNAFGTSFVSLHIRDLDSAITSRNFSVTVSPVNDISLIIVDLRPDLPQINDSLTCAGTVLDADGDAVVANFALSGARTQTGTISCPGNSCVVQIAGPFASGQNLTCSMTPFDSSAFGNTSSDTVFFPIENITNITNITSNVTNATNTTNATNATNSRPSAALSFSPSSPQDGNTLLCNVNTFDADNDSVVINYSLSFLSNTSNVTGVTGATVFENGSRSCASCTLIINSSFVRAGNNIVCTVTPRDSRGLFGDTISLNVSLLSNVSSNVSSNISSNVSSNVSSNISSNVSSNLSSNVSSNNFAPVITSVTITPPNPSTENNLICSASAFDPEGDSFSLLFSWMRNFVTVVSGNAVFASMTSKGEVWTCNVAAVSGNQVTNASASVIIGNSPPVITSSPVTHFTLDRTTNSNANSTYRYDVTAFDPDNDTLSYSLDAAPAGMTISSSGVIIWNPQISDVGIHTVTVRVSDGSLSALQSYQLTVGLPQEVNTNREKLYIANLFIPTLCVAPGDSSEISITLKNTGFFSIKDAKITAYVPDLSVSSSVLIGRLNRAQSQSVLILLDIPADAPEGWYDVRVAAGDDIYRRYRHREVLVSNNCNECSIC